MPHDISLCRRAFAHLTGFMLDIRVPYRASLFSVSDPAVLFLLSLFLQPALLFLSDVL